MMNSMLFRGKLWVKKVVEGVKNESLDELRTYQQLFLISRSLALRDTQSAEANQTQGDKEPEYTGGLVCCSLAEFF